MNKLILNTSCIAFLLSFCLAELYANVITGDLNRVVIMARFNGDPDFEEPKTYYEDFFNGSGERTVKSYFKAISNNKLNVNSMVFPKATQPEKSFELKYCYYCYDGNWSRDYPSCKGSDISTLSDISIGFVIKELAADIEPYLDESAIDKDFDGYVDDFVIVLRGGGRGNNKGIYSPQTGEISQRFINTNGDIYLKGRKINKYTIVYERNTLDTHCRFLLNQLGFPDLFPSRTLQPRPVGVWDVMDGPELTYPLVYNRWNYSSGEWVDEIPVAESAKTYVLNEAGKQSNTAFKVETANPDEFFVLEYRNNTTAYNRHLPESGMLIYRVNNTQTDFSNQMPEFYVFRKDGTLIQNGDLNAAAFSDSNGRSSFNSVSNPYPFSGDGQPVNLSISNIKVQGETLTFNINGLPTAIDDISVDNSTVYPSLTTGIVHIEGNWEKASAINLAGVRVFSKELSLQESANTIDLTNYPKGMYLLELQKNNELRRVKILLR